MKEVQKADCREDPKGITPGLRSSSGSSTPRTRDLWRINAFVVAGAAQRRPDPAPGHFHPPGAGGGARPELGFSLHGVQRRGGTPPPPAGGHVRQSLSPVQRGLPQRPGQERGGHLYAEREALRGRPRVPRRADPDDRTSCTRRRRSGCPRSSSPAWTACTFRSSARCSRPRPSPCARACSVGQVCIMFTDIKGSTALYDRLGRLRGLRPDPRPLRHPVPEGGAERRGDRQDHRGLRDGLVQAPRGRRGSPPWPSRRRSRRSTAGRTCATRSS